ncbi:MAG: hypothetical protein GXO37_04070 [Chloroflexi bacterium]|nr:hypothetical protein [Chloroflexota bacterium]
MNLLPKRSSDGRRTFRPGLDHIRLALRLLMDPRVPWYLKILPVAALVYFIVPDLIPTPLDDAVVLMIGVGLFLELAPKEVVEEYRRALQGRPTVTGRAKSVPREES